MKYLKVACGISTGSAFIILRRSLSTLRPVFPKAATCAMILELPRQCVSEEQLVPR